MALTLAQQVLNEMLERLARENDGCNHGSEYAIYALPNACSLKDSLDLYFSHLNTSDHPSLPPDRWNIRTQVVEDFDKTIGDAARFWFYELEFSPKVDSSVAIQTISEFLNKLLAAVGDASAFVVQVTPPIWYECTWQDFAFNGGDRYWLLHFGFSD